MAQAIILTDRYPVSAPQALPAAAPTQTAPRQTNALNDIKTWERRTHVSARWCDVGLSLLLLASGVAALFRLIWTGQP